MTRAVFAIPGDLARPTGGYRYDREILARAASHGVAMTHLPLPAGFPNPSAADLRVTAGALAGVDPRAVLVVDGLAFGAMTEAVVRAASAPVVALVHHPLALETGATPARAAALEASERAALAHARRVVVTHHGTATILAERYGVERSRITVAEPGTDRRARAHGSGGPGVALMALGSLSPRKGYDVLIAALSQVKDLDWTLTIAGAPGADRGLPAALADQARRAGIADRVAFRGALDVAAVEALFAGSDLFVQASRYEGYGMAAGEALAHGLPVVATRVGLFETWPDEAAILVPPDDPAALGQALRRVIAEPGLRARLAGRSFAEGLKLPDWNATAHIVCGVCREIAP